MRFSIPSLLWLALACNGICQTNPPTFSSYTGPTLAYPETGIGFTLLAKDHQPDSIGSNIEYDLLSAPSNTSLSTLYGRPDEKFSWINWQTPVRSAIGTTNLFVIRATDEGVPPLTATSVVSFVVIDLPPIRSIALSNRVCVLQFDNPLPIQSYIVQWTDALPTTNWSLLSVLYSASPSITVTDTNPPASQRFYRLRPYGGWCYGFCP